VYWLSKLSELEDKIIVLDEGKIAESGNHEQIMALSGIYYNMYEQQQTDNWNFL